MTNSTYTVESLTSSANASSFINEFVQIANLVRDPLMQIDSSQITAERTLLTYPLGCKFECWIVRNRNDSQMVARICASLSVQYPERGLIGFFETKTCESDPPWITDLFDRAFYWLKNEGVKIVYGPVNFNTWFDYRYRLQDESKPGANFDQFDFEPKHPIQYKKIFEKVGFTICEKYFSCGYDHLQKFFDMTKDIYGKAQAKGYTFSSVSQCQDIELLAKQFYRLNTAGFSQAVLYEPISFKTYRDLFLAKFKPETMKYSCLVMNRAGEEVGFSLCFFEKSYVVAKTIVFLPEEQKNGLGLASLHWTANISLQEGAKKFITAMVRYNAPGNALANRVTSEPIWRHDYGLFSRMI